MVQIHGYTRPVGTSASELISFYPRDISSILIQAVGAMRIGTGGSPVFPLAAGGTFGLTYQDFSPEAIKSNTYLQIFADADVATSANILVVRR